MNALEAILTRRSTRRYKDEMARRGMIKNAIEEGRYASDESHSRNTHFIVITDKKILSELAEAVKTEFSRMEAGKDTYVSIKHAINASKTGNYIFHYNAPVLIVIANKRGYGNAMADSACALENMMIAGNALNLGTCWINQLHWLDDNEKIREFLAPYGLGDDDIITRGLAIGILEKGAPDRGRLE